MRVTLLALILLLCATPAFAQTPAPVLTSAGIERVLNDPTTTDKLANVVQAMSQAFLNLPVGQMRAAVEGRQPRGAERRETLRDVARRDDPDFDRNFARQIANAKPMIAKSIQALGQGLPAMMQSLRQAEEAIDRAAANMPDPNYPKR